MEIHLEKNIEAALDRLCGIITDRLIGVDFELLFQILYL